MGFLSFISGLDTHKAILKKTVAPDLHEKTKENLKKSGLEYAQASKVLGERIFPKLAEKEWKGINLAALLVGGIPALIMGGLLLLVMVRTFHKVSAAWEASLEAQRQASIQRELERKKREKPKIEKQAETEPAPQGEPSTGVKK